jgi:phosphate:Na+ symporter
MMQLTDNALTQMNVVMNGRKEEQNMKETERIENEINELRTILKEQNIQDVNNHQYDYSIGTIYIDLINECEKLGDYVVNVMEARLGK